MDLQSLSPEQLRALKAQLDGLSDTSGRSPIKPRQLHDLRLLPTATDPRPTFFPSAESPRDAGDLTKTSEFPKLLWHSEHGTEVTAQHRADQDALLQLGYVLTPPADAVVDVVADVSDILATLSDEDRALVLKAQQQERLTRIQERLANLSPAELERVIAAAGDEPAKRKPGRPKSAVA